MAGAWGKWVQPGLIPKYSRTGNYLWLIVSQACSKLRKCGGQQRRQHGLPRKQRAEQAAQGLRHCAVWAGHAALEGHLQSGA